jgi:hypothetical protein
MNGWTLAFSHVLNYLIVYYTCEDLIHKSFLNSNGVLDHDLNSSLPTAICHLV